ncbi:MAG: acetyl-CoA carboxylase carboxyltransferase subunit alpha [Pyrinomonadaceae bacterium]|nr:acetyl-CoA carboxylase carboxyltransferase subunit alpha [Pyrinomonadaceae bacterium]
MKKETDDKNAFERVQIARDAERPYTNDLLETIFSDFQEIHGDRRYADDPAVVCGFAKIDDYEVAVIGQQKGRDINSRRHRNFAMPKPEGYRKALRMMKLAEKFGRPVITLIDTPGAYPGIDAEERGQAEAIAFNLREMANLKVPTIVVVLGEGGSGGALAIGVGDRVLMLENSVYSVITPEGCAAILWKDAAQAPRAAESLKLTAANLLDLGLVDEIVTESEDWKIDASTSQSGGEVDNSKFEKAANELKKAILQNLKQLEKMPFEKRMDERYKKFRNMGKFIC